MIPHAPIPRRAKRSVLIAGGGLAGLAAGLALRTHGGGDIDVTVLERRGFAGGKASAAGVDAGGHLFEIEHGLHVVFDYPNLRRLLGEVDPGALARIRPATRGSSFYREGHAPVGVRPWRLPSPLHLLGGRALAKVGGLDASGRSCRCRPRAASSRRYAARSRRPACSAPSRATASHPARASHARRSP